MLWCCYHPPSVAVQSVSSLCDTTNEADPGNTDFSAREADSQGSPIPCTSNIDPTHTGIDEAADVMYGLSDNGRYHSDAPESVASTALIFVGKMSMQQAKKNACDGSTSRHSQSSCSSVSMETIASTWNLPEATTCRPAHFERQMPGVAAGHADSILRDWREMDQETGVPEYVIKCRDENEVRIYEELQAMCDPIQKFIPTYYGAVARAELEEDLNQDYIRLSNLLRPYERGAHVMDCKVGIRSFDEDEVKKTKLRPDLYTRMLQLDPTAPTQAENEAQACTKYRWMTFNDAYTCLAQNGYRIDGIVASSAKPGPTPKKGELKKLKSLSDMARCIIKYFLPTLADTKEDDGGLAELQLRRSVAESMISRLAELRQAMLTSPFLSTHSFVGSSILFIVDANGPLSSAHLIDFAKTSLVPNGIRIDHSSPWKHGNHEDGLFIGVDNLSKTWKMVLQILTTPGCS